jgi:FkbM family methyltransferase
MKLDLRSEKAYWLGNYEPEMAAVLADAVEPGMVVYDAGANLGYLTLAFARMVGESGHVYAFEPLPANLARLQAHVDRNGFSSRVTICPLAVSGSCGTMEFRTHASHAMGRLRDAPGPSEGFTSSVAVEAVSLDRFAYDLGHPAPDIVKMDIEGAEAQALPAMTRLLREIMPLVLLESHSVEAGRTAWEVFQRAGYELFRLQAGSRRVDSVRRLGARELLLARRKVGDDSGLRWGRIRSARRRAGEVPV